MVVQHNITAMNANRMLGLTTKVQAKSTEKLSSGYKINRAADDAAGLAISEKMRKQIRGLTQASANAQDGISAVQTAEGALTEVHDMLQRMNELAVKAANGTNSESDRKAIQDEIDQLVTEIDRVSTTTKFNETYLLEGNAKGKAAADINATPVADVTALTVSAAKGTELKAGTLKLGEVSAKITTAPTKGTASVDPKNMSGDLLTALNESTDGTVTVAKAANAEVWTIGGNGSYSASDLKTMGLNVNCDKADASGNIVISKSLNVVDAAETQKGVTIADGGATAGDLKDHKVGETLNATIKTTKNATTGDMESTVEAYDPTYAPEALEFKLHVGADSDYDNKISVEIESMSAAGLGLLDGDGELKVDGDDSTNADAAIDTIAAAIAKVSTQRSALGAVQNRLEHTINNLDNVVENTTSAEAQIRDTDIATEMVKYANNNILQQAGTSMLSQANQSNQLALSLLG
ncbi:MAG: flagellin [Bacillus sp. (in: Bacteria)]|nr:flagellin [Bacillus sp. (in: firmicutes)]MCM1425570.1 hypothetical protein [Eubacterium sp.]